MTRSLVIIPSIRTLKNWLKFDENIDNCGYKGDIEVLVIDESNINRDPNNKYLQNVPHTFYGRQERRKWFKDRGISNLKDIIPNHCHAEISFGLLHAWEYRNDYDNVILIDDDVYPTKDDFFQIHSNQLGLRRNKVSGGLKWLNLISEYYNIDNIYSRGYPYSERLHSGFPDYKDKLIDVVMNQGLWVNQLSLNSVDILPSTNGLTKPILGNSSIFRYNNIYTDIGTYTTISSMNLCFKPEIIPAFYQLPMREYDVDRYEDIWSGLILKKISDHLNKYISHGMPLCEHRKIPRSTFKDIISESHGMEINESFYKVIDDINLNGNTWKDCYYETALQFVGINEFDGYFKFLGNKMIEWITCIDILE